MGLVDGVEVGLLVAGLALGSLDGFDEGLALGRGDGFEVGLLVGVEVLFVGDGVPEVEVGALVRSIDVGLLEGANTTSSMQISHETWHSS